MHKTKNKNGMKRNTTNSQQLLVKTCCSKLVRCAQL